MMTDHSLVKFGENGKPYVHANAIPWSTTAGFKVCVTEHLAEAKQHALDIIQSQYPGNYHVVSDIVNGFGVWTIEFDSEADEMWFRLKY